MTFPFVPAKAGTQSHTSGASYLAPDPRFRGNERSLLWR
jgi:hypothetical protein